MTDLYSEPGTADTCIEELSYNKETQALFAAAITYSRGEIDKVYEHARYFLQNHNGFYSILSGGILLSLVAMWEGDIHLWNEARRHITEAPCNDEVDRDIVALSIAAVDSAIRDTNAFPQWFMRGCFDNLPRDAHPAARVYYIKFLLIKAQALAMGNVELDGIQGFGLMRTLPLIMEPMISQMAVDKVLLKKRFLPKQTVFSTILPGREGNRVYSTDGVAITLTSNAGGFGGKTGLYEMSLPIKGQYLDSIKQRKIL